MLSRVTDRLVLRPTRYPLPTEGKTRRLVEFLGGQVEVWIQRSAPVADAASVGRVGDTDAGSVGNGMVGSEPELFILKLPGTGGCAERASLHPAEIWSERNVEVWAFNPPGYGGSSGRASLKTLLSAVRAVFDELKRVAQDRPVVLTGNSLGTVGALALAADQPVDALILRNPPPLRELIVGEYGWWNFTLAARLVASQVPRELDSVVNAARATAPAVFISSQRDRLVPHRYQRHVFEAYGGSSRLLELHESGHACPLEPHETQEYALHLAWLREQVEANRAAASR